MTYLGLKGGWIFFLSFYSRSGVYCEDLSSETEHVPFVPYFPPSGSSWMCLIYADDVLSVCPPVKGHPLPQHIIPAC